MFCVVPKLLSETVLSCGDIDAEELKYILESYGLKLAWVAHGEPIPGSYWGDSEAGLIGALLYVRRDTPVHSALHEACHYICMDEARRTTLDTNAGGDYAEENGVCYLQALLAEKLAAMGTLRMFRDMDTWGYTFRLGSAQAWFELDAADARDWLIAHGILDAAGALTLQLRR